MKSSKSSHRPKISPILLLSPQSSSFTLKCFAAFMLLAIGFALGMIKGQNIKSRTVMHSPSSSSSSLHLAPAQFKKTRPTTDARHLAPPLFKKTRPITDARHLSPPPFKKMELRTEMRGRSKGSMEPANIMNDMSDEELFWKASMVPRIKRLPYHWFPKIAFLFLTKGDIPLAPLWEKFFEGHEDLYSIYVHSDPMFNGSIPTGSIFYGRRIRSKIARWGRVNMMDAERRLLANALCDFTNERFVLLSESHIPLFNFSTIYSYLMGHTIYIESYDLPGTTGRKRYRQKMGPVIRQDHWRKGSQWFEMDRKLALEVISDEKYYPEFKKHCKSCVADEHYLPTLLNIKGWYYVENRSLTWVDWSKNEYHPANFSSDDVTVQFLKKLRHGTTCKYNGMKTRVCFLFARKFLPNCLGRLLELAPKVLFFG